MQQKFQSERLYINTILKLSYYFHALSRFDKPTEEREKANLIVLFADEGQEIITGIIVISATSDKGLRRCANSRTFPCLFAGRPPAIVGGNWSECEKSGAERDGRCIRFWRNSALLSDLG